MSYRAYVRIKAADDGKPLGRAGLLPVVENLNAHVREAEAVGGKGSVWTIPYDACRVATHLHEPVIRIEVNEAWEVRLADRVITRFLRATGWRYDIDTTSAYRRAR